MLKYPRYANLALIGNSAICASARTIIGNKSYKYNNLIKFSLLIYS
jgi:hypothetical protein